jgi:hypothetical protein
MNLYCVNLNFNSPVFKSDLSPIDFLKDKSDQLRDQDSKKIKHTKSSHFTIDIEHELSDELKRFFNEHNQDIVLAEVFRRSSTEISVIHSDDKLPGDYSKMNWVFGGRESVMNWYELKNEKDILKIHETSIESYSLLYRMDQVELLYSEAFRGPSIVQVGIPHNIVNLKEERFCLSVVFKDKSLGRRPTVSEAAEIFKDYIVQ